MLQAQALEMSMGMSGDFEQAISMCVTVTLMAMVKEPGCCVVEVMSANANNFSELKMTRECCISHHLNFRGATNVRLGSTIFGAR